MLKKAILMSSLLILVLACYSQKVSLADTQGWIKEKIELNSFKSNPSIRYEYKIEFDGGTFLLLEILHSNIQGVSQTLTTMNTIPIQQLRQVSFEAKDNNVWLRLEMQESQKKIKVFTHELKITEMESEVIVMLNKTVDSSFQKRIQAAFSNLITLSGGKVVNEVF